MFQQYSEVNLHAEGTLAFGLLCEPWELLRSKCRWLYQQECCVHLPRKQHSCTQLAVCGALSIKLFVPFGQQTQWTGPGQQGFCANVLAGGTLDAQLGISASRLIWEALRSSTPALRTKGCTHDRYTSNARCSF